MFHHSDSGRLLICYTDDFCKNKPVEMVSFAISVRFTPFLSYNAWTIWDGQGYTSPVKLQIDCGDTVSIIPRRHVPETVQLLETTVTLSMRNKTAVTPLGECVLKQQTRQAGSTTFDSYIIVVSECSTEA
jgi:hypothetical protein